MVSLQVTLKAQIPCPVGLGLYSSVRATPTTFPREELSCLPREIRHARGPGGPRRRLTGCLLFPVLPDGDLTDTVSGPRSTASDLTSSKASTKSPTQRHNPFSEDPAETVSSSDTTPVHTTSQEKGEPHTLDLPDACTELEVIRSAGRGPGRSGVSIPVSGLSTPCITFQSTHAGTLPPGGR